MAKSSGLARDSDALFLNNLHSFWIEVPQGATSLNGIGAMEHMIRVRAMFVIPADRFDTSTYSKTGSELAAYCYENSPGGIGVAKKLFKVSQVVLAKGVEIARSCRCIAGCQNCIEPAKSWDISNANINKLQGIALSEELLAAVRSGPDRKDSKASLWSPSHGPLKTEDRNSSVTRGLPRPMEGIE